MKRFILLFAFIALGIGWSQDQSPVRNILTTKGDVFVSNGPTVVRLPACSNNQVRIADSTTSTGWRCAPVVEKDPVTGNVAIGTTVLDAINGPSVGGAPLISSFGLGKGLLVWHEPGNTPVQGATGTTRTTYYWPNVGYAGGARQNIAAYSNDLTKWSTKLSITVSQVDDAQSPVQVSRIQVQAAASVVADGYTYDGGAYALCADLRRNAESDQTVSMMLYGGSGGTTVQATKTAGAAWARACVSGAPTSGTGGYFGFRSVTDNTVADILVRNVQFFRTAGTPSDLVSAFEPTPYPDTVLSSVTTRNYTPQYLALGVGQYGTNTAVSTLSMTGDWTVAYAGQMASGASTIFSLTGPAQGIVVRAPSQSKVQVECIDGSHTYDNAPRSAYIIAPPRNFGILLLTSSGGTLTLKELLTGQVATLANCSPTGTPTLGLATWATTSPSYPTDFAPVSHVGVWNRVLTSDEQASLKSYVPGKKPQTASDGAAMVVFDGDSLIEGTNVTGAHNRPAALTMQNFPFSAWANTGNSGTQLADMIGKQNAANYTQSTGNVNVASTFSFYSTARSKNVLVMLGGTNDAGLGGRTAAQIKADLATYWTAAGDKGYACVPITLLPRTDAGAPADWEATRADVNAYIVASAASWCATSAVVDAGADAVIGAAGASDTAYYGADHLHLSAQGNQVLAYLIQQQLTALGVR